MVILFMALALSVAFFAACYTCYRIAFHSPDRTQNTVRRIPPGEQYEKRRDVMLAMINRLAARPAEIVHTASFDGLSLAARYYESKPGAPVALCFHGYRSTGIRDFSGAAEFCLTHGQNVLLPDQRAHGLSEGHTITFGVKERYDCLSWINYIIDRFGPQTQILLYGVSMGASTVLMATGLPLPSQVKGVIADCPYASAVAIVKKVCRDVHLCSTLLYPFINIGAALFGGFSLKQADVPSAVASASVPILVIHGEDDRFVPCDMSRYLAKTYPDKVQLATFPDAGHGISYLTDQARYEQLVLDFLSDSAR